MLLGGLLLGATARAGFLNPLDYAEYAISDLSLREKQTVVFDTNSATLYRIGSTGDEILGTGFILESKKIAIFAFTNVRLSADVRVVGEGLNSLALLSLGSFTSAAVIDVSGGLVAQQEGGPGGGSAFGRRRGEGAGGAGRESLGVSSGGGGGGYGGFGGTGAPGEEEAGGLGGRTYGNLVSALRGGSAGGDAGAFDIPGGGGGGAIEIGTIGNLSIFGSILADGNRGQVGGSGGGSGGGILLHSEGALTLGNDSFLSARGGDGGDALFSSPDVLLGNPGGGGGGGRIYIQASESEGPFGFSNGGNLETVAGRRAAVAGGLLGRGGNGGASSGTDGQVVLSVIPEPSSLALLGLAAPAVGAMAWRSRRRGRAAA